jgi:hypothetical protein
MPTYAGSCCSSPGRLNSIAGPAISVVVFSCAMIFTPGNAAEYASVPYQ